MPGLLLTIGATASCPHAAPIAIAPSQPKVLVDGQAVATADAAITVAGCPFQVPAGVTTKPQPCVTAKWSMLATKVLIGGKPALLGPAPGTGAAVCLSAEQIPQGPPTISAMQSRVSGT